LIVTQGDTEPASVEQQRRLGLTCPSLYDLRNLFQINVEEGRHLWAMVYLLHGYFGRDGREEAEELLHRHSGDPDNPRILGTFNEPIDDWLSFFMFTYFTDRDGKYQLMSLAESAFDPLARTCRFMLTEESHHLFVGETGVTRVIRRALEMMSELKTDDPDLLRRHGVVDLPTIQRYINYWFSSSLDLFGSEQSSNAAGYFANGIKGRPDEGRFDEHLCRETIKVIDVPDDKGGITTAEVPTRKAMNEITREGYIRDCMVGLTRWNRTIKRAGYNIELTLPSSRFRRIIGSWANMPVDPKGNIIAQADYQRGLENWLPTNMDRSYIHSLMHQVTEPGKVAGWIAPPDRGINNQSIEHEYVELH
jgi:benzoyl-CoA 2,3-dioxygenase component B